MIMMEREISLGRINTPSLVHAPSGKLWLYGIVDNLQKNRASNVPRGLYSNIAFLDKRPNMTTMPVLDVITKSIPVYGPYGAFNMLNRNSTKMVFPLALPEAHLDLPEIKLSTDTGAALHIVCSSSAGFEVYRVDLLKGAESQEAVYYAVDGSIDIVVQSQFTVPYNVFIQAYANEISIYSPAYEIGISGDPANIRQEWLWNNLVENKETANRYNAIEVVDNIVPFATVTNATLKTDIKDMNFASVYEYKTNAYVTLKSTDYYKGTSSYVFWFNTAEVHSGTRGLLGSTESSAYLPSVGITGYSANLNLIVQSDGASMYNLSDNGYADGQWHMCVLRHDAERKVASISIDNGRDFVASNYTGQQPASPGPVTLGRLGNISSGYFNGSIGPLRTYDRLITPAEEFWLWNGGKGR